MWTEKSQVRSSRLSWKSFRSLRLNSHLLGVKEEKDQELKDLMNSAQVRHYPRQDTRCGIYKGEDLLQVFFFLLPTCAPDLVTTKQNKTKIRSTKRHTYRQKKSQPRTHKREKKEIKEEFFHCVRGNSPQKKNEHFIKIRLRRKREGHKARHFVIYKEE